MAEIIAQEELPQKVNPIADAQLGLPPEFQNLAASLPEDELVKIGRMVCEEYKEDKESSKDYWNMVSHWRDLYFQQDRPKNPPWVGSSDESMPLLAEACNQFQARAFQAMFPPGQVIKCVPAGNLERADVERASRVGKHLSWQLLTQDRTYKAKKDALLLAVVLDGSFFTKVYFDPLKGRNVTVNVRSQDLVVPYGVGPRDLEDIERKTHEIRNLSVNDTKILTSTGYLLHPAEPYQFGKDPKPSQESIDRASGLKPSGKEQKYDAFILEQHRLLDLDEDGISEPYIVTVDYQTEKVLRIAIRYETDEVGNPSGNKEPIEYFTHWFFLPNADGFYGLGMGHLIGKINTAVNKLLRQTVDAGSLQNTKSGFIKDTLGVRGGEVELMMGKYRKIRGGGGRIQDDIFEMTFSPPSPAVVQIMSALMGRSDRLATVTEALSGQMESVQQPSTVLALIDQGLQVFSAVYERLWDAWGRELDKHYRLNSKYLAEQEYVTVLDISGLERIQISKNDYAEDLQIEPVADPKMATEQQKITRAQAQYQFLMSNPLVMSSPPHIYEASKRMAEALEIENLNAVLPRPQTDPLRVDDPKIENMGLLMPQPIIPPVYEDQDHMGHLASHQAMRIDPVYGSRLSPVALALLEQHEMMHVSYLYGLTETSLPEALGGAPTMTTQYPQPTAPPPQPMMAGPGMNGAQPQQQNGAAGGPQV